MKTNTKKHIKAVRKTAVKHKAQVKQLHHKATHKKLVKKKTSQRTLRGFFIIVAAISMSGLAFAIATTGATVSIGVHTSLKPGTTLEAPKPPTPPQSTVSQSGIASWYAIGLPAPDALTCASTKFGRGTYLQVTNKRNGKVVTCLVNDYGPAAWTGRAIDLSRGSFTRIESLSRGTTPVDIRVVPPPPPSLNLNFNLPTSLGSFMGYNLCQKTHSAQFCDANRQKVQL